jgi:hypothetical protein
VLRVRHRHDFSATLLVQVILHLVLLVKAGARRGDQVSGSFIREEWGEAAVQLAQFKRMVWLDNLTVFSQGYLIFIPENSL